MIECIIQARMGSSRLPGKTLMELENHMTTLDFVVNQLSCSKLDRIIIATTSLIEDKVIYEKAKILGIESFRGSNIDVLDRYYQCAKKFRINTIVRITADCPLVDPDVIDEAIKEYQKSKCDYLTNSLERTFPNGTEVEIFSFKSLEKAWKNAKKPSEREHVTPYFYNNQEEFNIFHLKQKIDQSKYRYSLDQEEDFELLLEIVSRIKQRPIHTNDIISLLEKNPELLKLNSDIQINEGYIKSIKEEERENEKKNFFCSHFSIAIYNPYIVDFGQKF